MIRSILLASLLLLAGESLALQCVKTGTACVDATPCKKISGVDVCLTDPAINAACWQYTDTYNCTTQNPVDYCSAINSTAGCQQVDSVCATPGATPGSGCMRWTNTYRCGASTLTRNNTVLLDSSYTTATDVTSATQCASAADNPTCTLAENASGVRSYTCMSQSSNCAALQSQGCTLSTSTCVSPAGGTAANCMLYEKSYSCPTAGATSTVLDCGAQQYCTGGNCFNSGHTPDTDLALAVSAHEAGRQAMTYVDSNQRLFSGNAESCVHNSLSRCCDSTGGAVKNSSMGGKILTTAGGQSIVAGSKYMYDIMYNGYQAYRAMSAMSATAAFAGAAATSAAAATSFSMSTYGLAMSWSSTTGFSFAFDPTSFAVAVAILIVVELTSCEKAEKELAQKNGAGLCRQYGASCNGFFCTSVTRSYCCFNSKLAKIINTAAVAQIGRANSDCTGLTMTEFGMLNFAAIDLGEFTAEIMSNIQLPTTVNAALCANGVPPDVTGTCADGSVPAIPPNGVDAIRTDVNAGIQRKLINYYTTGRQ